LFVSFFSQRKFSRQKWASLVILTIGVAIVQVSGSGDKHVVVDKAHRLAGLVAVLCAACTSGFAGVYFERILKGSTTTLWLRNVQMGLPSIVIAFFTIYSKDSAAVAEHGMLGGFSSMVWTVVVVQAAGGLIVAVVVKYADNVLKVFATSFSIIISCIISAIWFDFHATYLFILGAGCVVFATGMYSAPEGGRPRTQRKSKKTTLLPSTNTNPSVLPSSRKTAQVM
jgi:UDP-sugar transporter A1/2/3